MKCYRILYTIDNTAFMVYAKDSVEALKKARERNVRELDEVEYEKEEDYIIDEFTIDTNGTGILAFYDCYSVHERKDIIYENRIKG